MGREHLIFVKSIFSLSASVPAREDFTARERGRAHYNKCKTEMLPMGRYGDAEMRRMGDAEMERGGEKPGFYEF